MNPLLCPVCQKQLYRKDKQFVCKKDHTFDVAKEGYTNLLQKSSKTTGDSKEMVVARSNFLQRGYYQPLCNAIIDVLSTLHPTILVDAGCGEGYYTNTLQNRILGNYYAFDMSKYALRYASKKNRDVNYFLASIFHLPIAKQSVDVILNIFAPIATKEFIRVLKDDGYIIKVDPGENHLLELKGLLYDKVYLNEVKTIQNLQLILSKRIAYKMQLDDNDIKNLLFMTPYLHRTPKAKIEELKITGLFEVSASFILNVYKKVKIE